MPRAERLPPAQHTSETMNASTSAFASLQCRLGDESSDEKRDCSRLLSVLLL
jgi:hypothetical protein